MGHYDSLAAVTARLRDAANYKVGLGTTRYAERDDLLIAVAIMEEQLRLAAEANKPDLGEVARMVHDGAMSLSDGWDLYPSCSQKCLLALAVGDPEAVGGLYGSPGGAWLRLDERQRDILREFLPSEWLQGYVVAAQQCKEIANHGGPLISPPVDPGQVFREAQARDEGISAYRKGMPMAGGPYDRIGGALLNAWLGGWMDADEGRA